MPQMFRPGGVTGNFRSFEEGERAGFYRTFNDMAKAQKAIARGEKPPVAKSAPQKPPAPPAREPLKSKVTGAPPPPPPVLDDDDTMVVPVHDDLPLAPKPQRPLPDMELGEVKKLAEEFGLDVTVHHMTLRAQVEERLNAESGSD